MTEIDAALVESLIAEQFPQWAVLPVSPVAGQGWDNRTFRLGEELSVRLPSAAIYAAAVEKEDAVLPVLAAALPLPVPESVATGSLGHGYPFAWPVCRWLPGHVPSRATTLDHERSARDLAVFLTDLQATPVEHGPAAGKQSLFRGCHPTPTATRSTGHCTCSTGVSMSSGAARSGSMRPPRSGPPRPVWVHGDLDLPNLLIDNGRLRAVLDFGCCAVGDPACDLALAWIYFSGPAREAFRQSLNLDVGTWRRARGWMLWKALVSLAGMSTPTPEGVHDRNLTAVLEVPMP